MGSSIGTIFLILFHLISQPLITASNWFKYKWITYLSNILYHTKSVTFWNEGTFSRTLPVQDLPVILKRDNLQSLYKVFDFFIALKFCNSDFYFLNRLKKWKVATYNTVSVYMSNLFISNTGITVAYLHVSFLLCSEKPFFCPLAIYTNQHNIFLKFPFFEIPIQHVGRSACKVLK